MLRLPYYWDEGGYYIPAALDFFHSGTLIPHFTNAHPPLPNIFLGTLWHIVGVHILATRLLVCAFAAAGLLAVYRLAQALLGPAAALCVAILTAVYPIWFAQSTLAHADIFAAAFTLWAFALYFTARPQFQADGLIVTKPGSPQPYLPSVLPRQRYLSVAVLFSLAALSKETSIVQPVALAGWHIAGLLRERRSAAAPRDQLPWRDQLSWIGALLFPILPLVAWFAYHRLQTGFIFGNPEYLRYNATANFSAAHVFAAFRYRFLHLFWQRNIWVAIVLAIACLFRPRPASSASADLPPGVAKGFALLVAANWLAFSILGGALLTRYLLPIYPLILLACVGIWQTHTRWWPALAAFTAAAFLSGLWINPPLSFAPEDTLVYRDMIVIHQEAISFVATHYPDARILTAWPVSADLFRPELGYVAKPLHAIAIENFSFAQISKAGRQPGDFDTAIVFSTHYLSPAYRAFLLRHPGSTRGREFAADRDLSPAEIAALLHGRVVWQDDRNGEWAAVLRLDRGYEAQLLQPIPSQASLRTVNPQRN